VSKSQLRGTAFGVIANTESWWAGLACRFKSRDVWFVIPTAPAHIGARSPARAKNVRLRGKSGRIKRLGFHLKHRQDVATKRFLAFFFTAKKKANYLQF